MMYYLRPSLSSFEKSILDLESVCAPRVPKQYLFAADSLVGRNEAGNPTMRRP